MLQYEHEIIFIHTDDVALVWNNSAMAHSPEK